MRGFFYAPTINSPPALLFIDRLLGGEGRRLRKKENIYVEVLSAQK